MPTLVESSNRLNYYVPNQERGPIQLLHPIDSLAITDSSIRIYRPRLPELIAIVATPWIVSQPRYELHEYFYWYLGFVTDVTENNEHNRVSTYGWMRSIHRGRDFHLYEENQSVNKPYYGLRITRLDSQLV